MSRVRDELARIHARDGRLVPSVVVHEAAPDDAPLHASFEWDDARAATAHRLMQARQLIKDVVVLGADGRPQAAYVHVASAVGGEGHYLAVEVIVAPERADDLAVALGEVRARFAQARDALLALERAASAAGREVPLLREAVVAADRAREAVAALG